MNRAIALIDAEINRLQAVKASCVAVQSSVESADRGEFVELRTRLADLGLQDTVEAMSGATVADLVRAIEIYQSWP